MINNLSKRIIQFERQCKLRRYTSDYYGLGRCLNSHLRFPAWFRPRVHMSHGVSHYDELLPTENNVQLYFSLRESQAKLFRKLGIRSLVTGSPFRHFRIANNIICDPAALGTTAFPVHSTHWIKHDLDWSVYAKSLYDLPDEFHPLTVCLYWRDYLQVPHETFRHYGIEVTTAGHMFDPRFADNFYSILRRTRYTTGNEVTSATYYAIDLGVPFFVYGNRVHYQNYGDRNRGYYYILDNVDEGYRHIHDLFDIENIPRVTQEQQVTVNQAMGVGEESDRGEIRRAIITETIRNTTRDTLADTKRAYTRLEQALFESARPSHAYLRLKTLVNKSSPDRQIFEVAAIERKLRRQPRYTPGNITACGRIFHYADSASFLSMYREIFVHEVFRCNSGTEMTRIIDIGANIGVSAIYFSNMAPDAEIIALEPNPQLYDLLVTNLAANGSCNVEARPQAVADAEGLVTLYLDGADASSLVNKVSSQEIKVPSVRLSSLLDRPVSLLKIDIEGAETEVLQEAEKHLENVERLFVEYHSIVGDEQSLDLLLGVLKRAGFRTHIQPVNVSPRPFSELRAYQGMDNQLNIAAFRP